MAKQRLTEIFSKDWQEPMHIIKMPLQESTRLVEAEGKVFNVLEKWEIPVWRLGKKNLNGRTYKESLGKRMTSVYKETVTANLADHPKEEGSVKDIWAVSKNPHIREGIMYVDSYIVDEEFEKKLNRMIEAGYGIGVSSSVLGELDDDNVVIDESVELERWFDFCLEPSYSVFVTKESKITEQIEPIKEIVTIKEDTKETDNMSEKIKELTERNMRLNLDRILEDAEKKDTIALKIKALDEALTFVDDTFLPDIKEKIITRVTSLREESLTLAEKASEVPILEESIKTKETEKATIQEKVVALEKENIELKEKFELSTKLLDETKEYANKAESLLEMVQAEKGSCFSAKEYYDLIQYTESLEIENKALTEKITVSENTLKELDESTKKEIVSLKASNKELKEGLADYTQDVEDGLMNEDGDGVDDYTSPDEEFDYSGYGDNSMDDELELDVYNDDEVLDYYESLVREDSRYKLIKEDICKCKTLVEAQQTALRLRVLIEKGNKVSEAGAHSEPRMQESYKEVDAGKLKPRGWI